ncbi:hypothetical protein FLP10_11215 [Agromyces intestinalis]|uniref:Cupin domain-containing protein n=1 Tax=Agromyces intestinalis TaxID=2592652 RepID=A0A5C1YFT8_9MICO|nr:hypothetical protein [Agromyces intestinalis]QEO14921.1 hypothetical protein FLP10_11215 [Agromyces intestinalis]
MTITTEHHLAPANSPSDRGAVLRATRLFTDDTGRARFEDVELTMLPDPPPPDGTATSMPIAASAVLFARAGADTGHEERPEKGRQLAIGLAGSVRITASGEVRDFGPGTVLLIEDTTGSGHSAESAEGFLAAVVMLPEDDALPEYLI